jgi:hypothetical protein
MSSLSIFQEFDNCIHYSFWYPCKTVDDCTTEQRKAVLENFWVNAYCSIKTSPIAMEGIAKFTFSMISNDMYATFTHNKRPIFIGTLALSLLFSQYFSHNKTIKDPPVCCPLLSCIKMVKIACKLILITPPACILTTGFLHVNKIYSELPSWILMTISSVGVTIVGAYIRKVVAELKKLDDM